MTTQMDHQEALREAHREAHQEAYQEAHRETHQEEEPETRQRRDGPPTSSPDQWANYLQCSMEIEAKQSPSSTN
jgi:flagellar biosynthesis/type III secretory pathway protein FliH